MVVVAAAKAAGAAMVAAAAEAVGAAAAAPWDPGLAVQGLQQEVLAVVEGCWAAGC